jgi:Transposase DDE domain
MLIQSTLLMYPFLILLSTGKKSFENMGRIIKTTGRNIAKLLQLAEISFDILHQLSQSNFSNVNILYLIIDDTLIKKIFATSMRGCGMFYDTKLGRCINAFRLVTALISDGKHAIPIGCAYLFSKELLALCSEKYPSKDEIVKLLFGTAKKLFPNVKIVLLADGLYTSVALLKWCIENNISIEMRMHSNRVVLYKGVKIKLCTLANKVGIKLTGRQMARTVSVEWHDLPVEITIVKRIDKNDKESIVFQVSTYKAEPRQHVKAYDMRWKIEKSFRTEKQTLGLGDCYSTSLTIQYNHIASVLLAYGIAELERKKQKLKTPEDAIRATKERIVPTRLKQFLDHYDILTWFNA